MNMRVFADGRAAQEHRQEAARLNECAQAIKAQADAEGRDLTDEEIAEIDQLLARFNTEVMAAESQAANSPRRRVPASNPASGPDRGGMTNHRRSVVTGNQPESRQIPARPILAHVPGARMFDTACLYQNLPPQPQHPFSGVADLAAAVVRSANEGVVDPRLLQIQAAAPATSGTSAGDGGFAVPHIRYMEIFDNIVGGSDFLNLCDDRPLMSGMHSYPTFDGQNRSTGGLGGLTTQWTSETGGFTAQKPNLRTVEMQPKKAGTLVAVSNELLSDAAAYESQLQNALVENGRRALEEAVIRGSGGTEPLGVLNAPSLISVTRTSSRYADLLSCYEKNFARSRAVWIVHSTVLPELFKLNYAGDGASTDLAAPVFDLAGDGTYRLLGRPVIVSDVGNAASAVGDVIFVDLQSYILGIRAGMSIQTSAHLFFDFDAMAIRAIQRVDGSPKFMDKITQRDATTQNSWAVTIAA